jgi:hypothetical protein
MTWKGRLREAKGARRYNDRVTLVRYPAVEDEFGHVRFGDPVKVLDVFAEVRQMSATKTMLTFQQADVVGVDLEFRKPAKEFNGAVWRGHAIHFPTPEILDDRGRVVKISGWYQVDAPAMEPMPEPETTSAAQAVVDQMLGD